MIPTFSLSDVDSLRFTKHARAKMIERGVTYEEIVEVLTRPHVTEPHEGAVRYVRGDLVAVVAADAPVLITVLLRRQGRWTSEDARRR